MTEHEHEQEHELPDDGVLLDAHDDGRVWLALLGCAALGAAALAVAIVDLVTR